MPVSLIGTFAFVKLLGFSINTLTLFGIVLATGIVVDDAIVVIENVERHVREYRKGARQAASDAMREVLGALVATALVLITVFVPIAFFPGTAGRLYAQFALTIAVAVAISAFNALTLTPSLSALLLDRGASAHGKGAFFGAIEAVITRGTTLYVFVLRGAMRVKWAVVVAFVVGLGPDLRRLPERAAVVRARGGYRVPPDRRAGAGRVVALLHQRRRRRRSRRS